MASVKINICTDEQTKKQAEKLFAELGLNMTTAINIFLKKALSEGGIPFEVKRETPNAVTAKAIADAENENDVYGPFDSIDDLMEALNA